MPVRFLSLLSVFLVALLWCPVSWAQTTLYFSYNTGSKYPAVCTTGSLSCSVNSTGVYSCPTVLGGTHYYYPSATAPTYQASLVATSEPALCEQYTADFLVPPTANGFNIAYGSAAAPVCVNIRTSTSPTKGPIYADPDAVASNVTLSFSTTQSSVPTCPTPVAATASGSATIGFVYTVTGTATTVCGAGTLSCSSLGSNEYVCTSLQGTGTEYRYNSSSNTTTTTTLTSVTECNGFGDGFFPLNYEGISFAGAFSVPGTQITNTNCISWYGEGTGASYNYNVLGAPSKYQYISGASNFTYTTNPISPSSACAYLIPNIQPSPSQSAAAPRAALSLLVSALLVLIASLTVLLA